VTGVELRDPGMGFEWRLVPLAAAAQAERDRWDKTWADMSSERRETLLFDALAGDRLVIREITERMSAALGYVPTEGVYSPRPLHGGEVTKLVNRLWRQGRLDREAETFNVNHTRYRYSRPGSVPAPTAEVVAIRREAT
ncbi:MAG: hypothetical protein ACRDLK_09040, partial [Gaiellaceae bacterium]